MKKGHPPSLLSSETDGKLVRKSSNNIPKIILMIDDPVIDTPSSLMEVNIFHVQSKVAVLKFRTRRR